MIKFSPVVVLVVLGLHFCMGQGISTHTIAGVLQDQTGAVIVGAEVVLLAPDGSNVGTTSTNKAGEFEFHAQRTGSYTLRAHQEGFKDGTTTIKVGESAVINVRMVLAVSTLDEQVSVESQDAAPQVATESAQNQDVNEVDRGELDRLPVFDRNYIATLSRFLDSDQTGTNGVSLIVNGVEANGPGMTSSAIKNVKINQNPYSALYAKPGRARIEIETAEGTPQFHGTINFLLRNSVFDAGNAFALIKPSEQRNYVEGSLTGPLGNGKKNTFVLSLQQDYDNKEAIVAAIDATGPVNVNVPNPDHHFFGSGRVFHTPREGEQVYLSYSYERESIKNQGVGGTVLPEAGTNYLSFEHEINVGYNRVISAHLLNQLHFLVGYNENPVNSISNTPGIDVSGEFRGGGAQLTLRRTEGHFDGTDVMTYVRDKHEMKFGVFQTSAAVDLRICAMPRGYIPLPALRSTRAVIPIRISFKPAMLTLLSSKR